MLNQNFFNQPTLKVAQDLLGCFIIRKVGRKIIRAKIVETEAYNGPRDLASHASRGRTARNAVMFGPAGMIYVYFTYGLHFMLNIVTGKTGYPAAVLIRALEPVEAINHKSKIINLKFNGPARLTKTLAINKTFNHLPIFTRKHGLWLEKPTRQLQPKQIIRAKRIGVDYAGAYKDKKWRYYLKDNNFVSKK